ncbi:MAG: hypothetical protein GY714_17875 [Desulfobacterales bacterium]|nr:hypothetical protein [Desulfobacterales bacterium]
MKKSTLLFVIILSFFVWSCGQSNEDKIKKSPKQTKSRVKKAKKEKMTLEKYSKIKNETRKLLMEKYWVMFKGKKYSDVKDLFSQYVKEEKDIYKEHEIDKPGSLVKYFRGHFKEIDEYKAKDPEYKNYPEYAAAARTIMDYTVKHYSGGN